MTSNQIAYAQLLEAQRSNKAKEAETERSNRAKELETRRSNLASEYNASEKNASSIKNIWSGIAYGLRNLGRANRDRGNESRYIQSGDKEYASNIGAVERSNSKGLVTQQRPSYVIYS